VTESAPVMAKLAEMVRTIVTQAIASAMPNTDSTNRSGRRRMFASANRTRHTNVLPDADAAISGDRAVVIADVSTRGMLEASRFSHGDGECPAR
jgi:hypothetical protein